ncbi:hypothetical protein [Amycolatopsis sp. cmx-11-32]|uniref:hypothetical protein n=1 Tax=Amycolatopsis sp. cmx-11-32 TaxID=2785796 RepID=UPI0039E40F86
MTGTPFRALSISRGKGENYGNEETGGELTGGVRGTRQVTAAPAVAVASPPNTIVIQPPAVAAPPRTVHVAPPTTRTVHPAPSVPVAQTVIAYYDAINRGDFFTAWNLGGRKLAVGIRDDFLGRSHRDQRQRLS